MMGALLSWRNCFYLIYALGLTAVLLYYRFPAEEFKSFCEKATEKIFEGSSCSIGEIDITWPLTVRFSNIILSNAFAGQPQDLVVDWLNLSPGSEGIKPIIMLESEFASGRFDSKLSFDLKERSFDLRPFAFSGLDVEKATAVFLRRRTAGEAEFEGFYSAAWQTPLDGSGQGRLQIKNGRVDLIQAIFSVRAIEYEKLFCSMTIGSKAIRLEEGSLEGRELNVEFDGLITYAEELLQTRLDMQGRLVLTPEFFQAHPREERVVQKLTRRYGSEHLPFRTGGTIAAPTFIISQE